MATLTPSAKQQFFDANGNPLSGGKLYTYAAGTTTPLATYTDAGGGTPNANPIILDSRGEANVWLGTSSYKLKLTTSTDVEIWTVDNIQSDYADALSDFAASSGSLLVGFLQSGSGATARTVQAKLRDMVSVKDFGAVGDGVADDTAALAAAFALTGRVVFIPAGTYKVVSTLTPVCAAIVGEGELSAIIKPTSAVTIVLNVGSTNYPRFVGGFTIDGASTTNAVGIYFGKDASCACTVQDVQVKNFAGASAVGVRAGDILKSKFTRLTTFGCYTGLLLQGTNAVFPTTLHFDSCVFTNSGGNGLKGVTGYGVIFTNCDFESSTLEGVKLIPGASQSLQDISFNECWFEANYANNTAQYHMTVDGSAAGCLVRPHINGSFFLVSASTCKLINITGNGAAAWTLNNPNWDNDVSGCITVASNAYGQIIAFPAQRSYTTNVSDAGNKISCADGAWASYTPTYSSDVGNAATTFSGGTVTTSLARYKIAGKSLFFSLTWNATLNAVTPMYIEVTLPTGLTSQTSSVYVPCQLRDATYQIGVVRPDGGTKLRFYRSDFAAYGSGAAVGGSLSGVIELA